MAMFTVYRPREAFTFARWGYSDAVLGGSSD